MHGVLIYPGQVKNALVQTIEFHPPKWLILGICVHGVLIYHGRVKNALAQGLRCSRPDVNPLLQRASATGAYASWT